MTACGGKTAGSSDNEGDLLLKIGETGIVQSNTGNYEMKVHKIQRLEEYKGRTPVQDYFFLLDIEIKNTGDSVLLGKDITRATLLSKENKTAENWYSDFLTLVPDRIEPGETVHGEVFFDQEHSEEYTLTFAIPLSDPDKTEHIWTFHLDDTELN
nr:DUF4352 domain-containing protein [Evansella tamaricis]